MRIFSTDYPGRIETATTDYPRGTFKDKSAAGANDGTPIADAERLKDWHGAFYGIMGYAGLTPNGNTDTATDSQIADAIFNSAAIGEGALSANAVTNAKIAGNAVTTSKIADLNVTNDKLSNNIQLDKISGGTLSISTGATTILGLNASGVSLGVLSEKSMSMYKNGIRFFSNGAPGEETYHFRAAYYDIASQISGATPIALTTTESSGHSHETGTQFIFAASKDTTIPNGATVTGATISYRVLGTSGSRRVCGISAVPLMQNGGSTLSVLSLSVYNQETSSTEFGIDASYPVILTIFHDGNSL